MLISVCLPVVKPSLLGAAIDSVLIQTYSDLELIILNNARDDSSKDEISSVVQSYDDYRISYYVNECQLAMGDNFNKVVSYCNGEFLMILSDDDEIKINFLSDLIKLSEDYPSVNIFHSRVLVKNGPDNHELTPLKAEYEDTLDFILNRIRGAHSFYLSDFLVRTSALKQVGGFDDPGDGWGLDDITWFKVASTGQGVAYSSNPNFLYNNCGSNEGAVTKRLPLQKLKSFDKYVLLTKEIIANIKVKDEFDRMKVAQINRHLCSYSYNRSLFLISAYLKTKKINRFLSTSIIFLYKIWFKISKK